MNEHDADDELDLFRQAVADVRPLRTADRVVDNLPPPEPEPRQRRLNEAAVIREMAEARYDPSIHEHGTELVFLRDGYPETLLKKLRRGKLAVEGHLDLHGMTSGDAKRAVQSFLLEAVKRRTLCVRIVHGKGLRSFNGEPVLKPALGEWLRRSDAVLAFCSAPLADGGTGAVYVALKAPKR